MMTRFARSIVNPRCAIIAATALCGLGLTGTLRGAGQYQQVQYPPSTATNELQVGVTYTMWIPDGVKTLRGIIVHQHGAGMNASVEGSAAAYDLHWQALSKKWDCALLGPSYHVLTDKTDDSPGGSQLWFDPRRGSEKTFLKALGDLAHQSGHPELEKVPWVLWGHSGGGIWSDVMSALHPDRVAAMWLRSGSAAMWRARTNFTAYPDSDAVNFIPIMGNAGIEEKGNGAWNGPLMTVKSHRAKGGPSGFAPDPLTGHWCGNSRYLAIPFIDACLAMRLPDKGSQDQTLKPVDMSQAWLAPLLGDTAVPAASFQGDPKEANWLPNKTVAKDWMEYVKMGGVSDTTPPPAPFNVQVLDKGEQGSVITWEAEADFESGLYHFIILRDGLELGNCPAVNMIRFKARPTFQSGWLNSFGDTPAYPLREMRFEDPNPKDKRKVTYAVISVNTVGLKSEPAAATSVQSQ
jgi:pimeloyl-ACP methyl ester carboxylesterase